MRDTTQAVRVVVLGHGGWRIPWGRGASLSGYGDDWREEVAAHAVDGGAMVIDLTTVPDGALVVLSYSGPMLGPDLSAGMIDRFVGGIVPFVPGGDRGFLGNAYLLDQVALDVYTAMTAYVGAAVDMAYRDGAPRPDGLPAWLPRRRHRPEGWVPPSVRRSDRVPVKPAGQDHGGDADALATVLPAGWSLDGDDAFDALLVCPHGHTIEPDGRCPLGCVSPLLAQGLI